MKITSQAHHLHPTVCPHVHTFQPPYRSQPSLERLFSVTGVFAVLISSQNTPFLPCCKYRRSYLLGFMGSIPVLAYLFCPQLTFNLYKCCVLPSFFACKNARRTPGARHHLYFNPSVYHSVHIHVCFPNFETALPTGTKRSPSLTESDVTPINCLEDTLTNEHEFVYKHTDSNHGTEENYLLFVAAVVSAFFAYPEKSN